MDFYTKAQNMKKMMQTVTVVLCGVSGCAAVYSWDKK